MYDFRTAGGGRISFDLDFTEHDYANLSFFDAGQKRILFHVSLRRARGLAAANSRTDGKWGREIRTEVSLARKGDRAEIRFEDDGIRVALNGYEIFHFDAERFPDVDAIAHVNYRGGLVTDSISMGGLANERREGVGELSLEDDFVLSGWAVDPALARQTPCLEVEGLDEPIAFHTVPAPQSVQERFATGEDTGLRALLPGRVWLGVPEGQVLRVKLTNNGIPCGDPLLLSREDVAGQIVRLTKDGDFPQRMQAVLSAVEHVRFGKLWPLLPASARRTLLAAADRYGVRRFLLEETEEDEAGGGHESGEAAGGRLPRPPENPQALLLDRVRGRFMAGLEAGDERAPIDILAALLEDYPMGPTLQRQLFLALCETFCLRDAFDDLHAFAAARGLADFKPDDRQGDWYNSAILPFLCRAGALETITRLLWRFAERRRGWLVMPAIAWTIRALLAEAARERETEEVFYAFLGLLESEARSYWGRAASVPMMEALVQVLARQEANSAALHDRAEQVALSACGLSRRFWRRLEEEDRAGRLRMSPRLKAGFRAFAVIEAGMTERGGARVRQTADAALDRALGFFEKIGNPDAGRMRLECFGPAGVTSARTDGTALVEALVERNPMDGGGLLRALAFPGAPALEGPGAEAAAALVRAAVRERYQKIPKALYHDLQSRVSRQVVSWLATLPDAGGKDGEAVAGMSGLSGILHGMAQLAGVRSGHLGIGMGLALMEELLRRGLREPAMRIMAWLNRVLADLPPEHQDGLFRKPPVFGALSSMAWRARILDEPLLHGAMALFPRFAAAEDSTFAPPATVHEDWPQMSAWFNVIVVVFSCRRFLETRIEPMRRGWLSALKPLGIPHVVVVGDGDGRREGDVVHLDAPDDYEGLPWKTLKAVEWVARNTPFSWMLKIDDDCLLDAETYFHARSYGKFDYYGRRLSRQPGNMDRVWHMKKAVSARGRLELDKSPEPSEYCDGGSGYALSRAAMEALLKEAATPDGRMLTAVSFMEDKLVGDLLARADIRPADEDCQVAVLRRTHADAVPVSQWENGFFPGPASGTGLVHLDTHLTQGEIFARIGRAELKPRKIWPTEEPVRLGSETNMLELVSSEDRLEQLAGADLAVVACLRNEMFMLPHFLAHYRRLGVSSFLIVDNCSDDGSREYLLEQPDVAVFSADTPYGLSHYGVSWQKSLLASFRVGLWTLVADIDELLIYPRWRKTSLARHLADPAFASADAVRIYMLDMYPEGSLKAAGFESGDPFAEAGFTERRAFLKVSEAGGPHSDSITVTSALRHRLIPGSRPELFVAQKYALLRYRPWMRLTEGLHYVAETDVAEREMVFAHFKYNAHFRAKAEAEVARGQHFNDAEEYRKYLALMSEGREVIFSPEHSVPWRECEDLRRIFGPDVGRL